MKRQRNSTQMKEQTRNTEVQINEEEIGKLPEKEFRIMIVKMIKKLENKMEKMQGSINKDLEELKNKYTNNTITEIKNILEGINSRASAERSAVTCMAFPLYVTCCFSLLLLIFFLCVVFVSLINMCLGKFLLGFTLYGTLYASWA